MEDGEGRILIHVNMELTREEREALSRAYDAGQKAYGEVVDRIAASCLKRAQAGDIALAEEL